MSERGCCPKGEIPRKNSTKIKPELDFCRTSDAGAAKLFFFAQGKVICLNVSKISCLVGSRFQRRLSEVYTVRSTYHQQFYLRIAANFYGYKKAIKQHILRLYNKPLFTIMKMACAACVLVQKKIVHLHMKMNQFRQWLEQFLATRFANTTS